MKNLPQVVKTWKEIRDNSVYMQDRKYNSIMRTIESYTEENMISFIPGDKKQFFLNFLMWTTKFGDRSAIMLGGMANYNYYKEQYRKKNPKASEQEVIDYAIKKFEKDTKRTQQSGDIQDKDYFQRLKYDAGGPVKPKVKEDIPIKDIDLDSQLNKLGETFLRMNKAEREVVKDLLRRSGLFDK